MSKIIKPTATVHAGARGFDALTYPVSPVQAKADGWAFRTIYISQSSRYPTKITDHNWREAIIHHIEPHHAAGVGILLNFESSTTRCLEGSHAGAEDGRWSSQLAKQLGYPAELPILVSFDTDVREFTGGDPTVRVEAIEYGRAFVDACAYPIGIYGGLSILHGLVGEYVLGWQAMARSWSLGEWPHAKVHMKQRRATADELRVMPYASAIDVNDVTASFPVWLPTEVDHLRPTPAPPKPAPVPQPTTEEDDMEIGLYRPTDCDAQFLGYCKSNGHALQVEWTGSGDDPAVQATIKAHLDAGARVFDDLSFGGFANCTLIGPLPTGDPKHEWTGAEFRRWLP